MSFLPAIERTAACIWNISWQAGLLIVLVLAVQRLLRSRLSPGWQYALWLTVLVRLALPVLPESPLSLFNYARWGWETERQASEALAAHPQPNPELAPATPAPAVAPQVALPVRPVNQAETQIPVPARPMELPSASPPPVLTPAPVLALRSWPRALAALWLVGVAVLGLRLVWTNWRFARRLSGRVPVTDPAVLAVLEECREVMGVRSHLALLEVPEVDSPALFGGLRLKLLLPEQMTTRFSTRELRHVFLHELAHVRRRDVEVNWLMAVLQVLHWFNPLVWFAFSRMRTDRELACDALALRRGGAEENKSYGQTMLKLLAEFSRPTAVAGLMGILEPKQEMQRRVAMIAQFNRVPRGALLAISLMLGLGMVCLTGAQTGDKSAASQARLSGQRQSRPGRARNFPAQPGPGHWERRADAPLSPRHSSSGIWTGRELIVFGGESPGVSEGDGASYNPATDEWTKLPPESSLQRGRNNHTAVWTGKEMIIWGGFGGRIGEEEQIFNNGARFNPATGEWKPLSTRGTPSARFGHSAVWTGTEMIIWGGYSDGQTAYAGAHADAHLDDGARYSPDAGAWKPISKSNAPSKRYGHTAVWTGTHMILWGGADATKVLNDGCLYDPSDDYWRPLPRKGAPSARFLHHAIWTGSEMIVFGGVARDMKTPIADGARFNPETGKWTPIAATPRGTCYGMAVWTGKEIIAWGGWRNKPEEDNAGGQKAVTWNGTQFINTGARYNPATDTWTPITTEGAPSPRSQGRPAVWTGKGMLFFGGWNGGSYFNDTWFYRPPSAGRAEAEE